MKKITLFFTFLFLVTICFAQTPTSKIVLNKGQKFVLNSTSAGTTSMEMMGQNMETVNEATSIGTIEVKDVTPTSYKITSTINKMKINSKAMGQEVNFDSDKKEDMNGEMGQAVKDQFNPRDEEITYLGKASTIGVTANADNDMKKVMESLSGTGNNIAAANFMLIPAGKKVGDSWMDSSNSNGIRINNSYIIKQLNSNEASVITNTVSNINKNVQQAGQDITIIMDMKTISTNLVDVTTGLIKEKKIVTEGKGTINAGGQEIPMTSKITTVTTIKNM